MNAYVLQEVESGRYRCQNVYIKDASYHTKLMNAVMYESKEEADYYANSMNRVAEREYVKVIPIEIRVV